MEHNQIKIAMWSGPRNISTTLMRAFGNRDDTFTSDEPFYGHFLTKTKTAHPGYKDIINNTECNWENIVNNLCGTIPNNKKIWYQKQMSQHKLPNENINWIKNVTNCFLLRDPKDVILSYAKIYENMTPELLGFPQLFEIFKYSCDINSSIPIVINSTDILINPKKMLTRLCLILNINFKETMLSWDKGPHKTDGIWGKYWYKTLYKSTGFIKHTYKNKKLPKKYFKLYDSCYKYYEHMDKHKINE